MEPAQSAAPKKRGCFFYGCLSLSILTVVALVFAGGGLYYAYQNFSTRLDEIADSAPAELQHELLSQEETEKLSARVQQFAEATANNLPVEPLVLDAKELNSLIHFDPRFHSLKDHLGIEILNDTIKARVSFPLALFKRPDQYFNGTVTVRIVEGAAGNQIFIEEIEAKGKKVPDAILSTVRSTDLLAEARKNPEAKEFFEQIDKIQVKNGRIVLFGRAATSS